MTLFYNFPNMSAPMATLYTFPKTRIQCLENRRALLQEQELIASQPTIQVAILLQQGKLVKK
ncbi:hypothetical protein LguiA_021566 [Lonicera macranthoides]